MCDSVKLHVSIYETFSSSILLVAMLVKIKKLDGQKDDFNFDENDTVASVRSTLLKPTGDSTAFACFLCFSLP